MRTAPPPGKKRVGDWIGLKIKTSRVLKSGMMEIPPGTICEVTSASSGLSLAVPKCEHCGVRVFITHVNPRDVEVQP